MIKNQEVASDVEKLGTSPLLVECKLVQRPGRRVPPKSITEVPQGGASPLPGVQPEG